MNVKKKYGLTKNEIIRRPQIISEIFQSERFQRGHWLDIAFAGGTNRQVVFAATKRIRKAVERNRIKRLLREAYRLEKENFDEQVRLVLIGHENMLRAPLNDLRGEMRKMAAKINASMSKLSQTTRPQK
jgi:ribonuclease P protein component